MRFPRRRLQQLDGSVTVRPRGRRIAGLSRRRRRPMRIRARVLSRNRGRNPIWLYL